MVRKVLAAAAFASLLLGENELAEEDYMDLVILGDRYSKLTMSSDNVTAAEPHEEPEEPQEEEEAAASEDAVTEDEPAPDEDAPAEDDAAVEEGNTNDAPGEEDGNADEATGEEGGNAEDVEEDVNATQDEGIGNDSEEGASEPVQEPEDEPEEEDSAVNDAEAEEVADIIATVLDGQEGENATDDNEPHFDLLEELQDPADNSTNEGETRDTAEKKPMTKRKQFFAALLKALRS